MTKEQKFDEQLIAKIVAAASETTGTKLKLGHGIFGVTNRVALNASMPDGQVCAVGAGILYRGLDLKVLSKSPLAMFAEVHGVSREFAHGVSDGYEDTGFDLDDDGYLRGLAVGEAVRAWAEDAQ